MALKINIETIPHSQQRYNTVGDWYWGADASWQFRISQMSDWKYEILVAIHELVECVLCRYAGISQQAVDDFDMEFESRRVAGDFSEPGDSPLAPYRVQHGIATGVERIVAVLMGVSWTQYEEEINSL